MKIVVLSGPSGVGKNTLVTEVLQAIPELRLGASLATREPRPNDVPGKYTYVSREEFERRAKAGDLLEWATYNGDLYGSLQPHGDDPLLLEIEIQGAAQVKKLFPEALLVFVVPPGEGVAGQLKVLADRLQRRGTDAAATIEQRLQRAKEELQEGQEQADKVVVNDDLATAAQQTAASIQHYLTKS